MLSVLRELGAARNAYDEALGTCRGLDRSQPGAYTADVAWILNNLGNVLSVLQELGAARNAYEEALTLYRGLDRAQPGAYTPEVSRTLNNLGNVLSVSQELGAARNAFEEALAICRELDRGQPGTHTIGIAGTLNNLGNVLSDLRELGAARNAYEEALAICRELCHAQPGVYTADVARTLNNLGNVLGALKELTAARNAHEEALAIRRGMDRAEPAAYRADVASTLNNLGAVLHDLTELGAARAAYEEALAIYRGLDRAQSGTYTDSVAMTLNNLGNVLRDRRELGAARAAYQEAVKLYDGCSSWIDCSVTYGNLGLIEFEDDPKRAIGYFESAVERCERGLSLLRERENRDKFKRKIESAYRRLIAHHAQRAGRNEPGSLRSLLGYMESLRQVETLAEGGMTLEEMRRLAPWRATIGEMIEGVGKLSERLRREQAAILWVHATEAGIVFAALRPGECPTGIAPQDSIESHVTLHKTAVDVFEVQRSLNESLNFGQAPRMSLEEALLLIAGPLLEEQRRVEAMSKRLATLKRTLTASAAEAFDVLPELVKALFRDTEVRTIFLAPCTATFNLPFELLRDGDQYIGLDRVMPRVHGLAELMQVLDRQPTGSTALVIGDPAHDETTPRLAGAHESAEETSRRLAAHGYRFVPDGIPLIDPPGLSVAPAACQASLDTVRAGLASEDLALVVATCHGGPPSDGRNGEVALKLSKGGELLSEHIREVRFPGTIIHEDCCLTGVVFGHGGGRFTGHPPAALQAGASCVLASAHPLWDAPARHFSSVLYALLLDRRETVGDALLAARRALAKEHPDNPLVWATTVLWGNPFVTLPCKE